MTQSNHKPTRAGIVWRELFLGQTFGVAFAVILFVVEAMVLNGDSVGRFGASVSTVFAVYAGFGWFLGALVGLAFGAAGALRPKLIRRDGGVPGAGPVIGFFVMAVFLLRMESFATLRSLPATVVTSLVAAVFVWVGLGYLGRRFVVRMIPEGRRPAIRRLLALVAIFTFLGPLGISRVESGRLPLRTAVSPNSPNIVLIVVDALRRDHLSAYGYARDTSPHVDRLAGSGAVFRNAYSQGNRTIIAMPSLFTSLYPSYHGAVGYQTTNIPLPASRTTIAEMCRKAGYTTVGLMSNVYLKDPFGMTQGFDRTEEFYTYRYRLSVYRVLAALGVIDKPPYGSLAPDATVVTDFAIEWLHKIDKGPFFLFMHFMDVHHPYLPPSGYEEMFASSTSDIDPNILFMKTAAMVKNPPPVRLPGEELQRLIDLYDACIRYTDDQIGRFLDELASLHLDRETVVFFTADHGDEFLEHGSLYHTNLLIESLIHVPMVVGRVPAGSGAGRTVENMVRHIDVLPTIADLIGAAPPAGIQGESFAPLLRGESVPAAPMSISEGDFCTAVNTGRWKIVHVDSTGTYQLYDLDNDPGESRNVFEQYPEEAARMRAIVDDYLAGVADLKMGEEAPLSEDMLRQLKALGYIQ